MKLHNTYNTNEKLTLVIILIGSIGAVVASRRRWTEIRVQEWKRFKFGRWADERIIIGLFHGRCWHWNGKMKISTLNGRQRTKMTLADSKKNVYIRNILPVMVQALHRRLPWFQLCNRFRVLKSVPPFILTLPFVCPLPAVLKPQIHNKLLGVFSNAPSAGGSHKNSNWTFK